MTLNNKYNLDLNNPIHFVKRFLIYSEARKIIGPNKKAKIVDLGCGLGIISGDLAKLASVDAYDVDARVIEFAKRANQQSNSPRFYVDNLFEIQKPSYDLVVCSEVLQYVTDDWSALKKINQLLKPKGYLILTVPFNKRLISQFDERERSRRYSLETISRRMEKANFTIRKIRYWGYPLLKFFYFNIYVPKSNQEAVKKAKDYRFSKISLWLLKYIRYIFLTDLLFNSKKSFGLLLVGQKK